MKAISSRQVAQAVATLAVEVNRRLPPATVRLLREAAHREREPYARNYLRIVLENLRAARRLGVPLCQDTGLFTVFVRLGPEVRLRLRSGETLRDAVSEGIVIGSRDGLLRPSVVTPVERRNTGTNAPPVVHVLPAAGDLCELTVMAKGFGSENMGRVGLLNPSAGEKGIEEFVLSCVREAGANPCPPTIVGVGIGGTVEQAALLCRTALADVRDDWSVRHPDWERRMLRLINGLGIGAGGFGGSTTSLKVSIRSCPTHMAGLPVAVSFSCWAHRVGKVRL